MLQPSRLALFVGEGYFSNFHQVLELLKYIGGVN
jgi:hypothetical protein